MASAADEPAAATEPAAVKTPRPAATLYVGDLDPTVIESDVVAAFEDHGYGPVSSARVCRDRTTGASLRYAYLNFADRALAENAMKAMNHRVLKGKAMRVMWSMRNPISRKSGVGNLFVKNLDDKIGGPELERLFAEHGVVVSCKVALDENGNSKGFGFVQMANNHQAEGAIAKLNDRVLEGGIKPLYVQMFVPKARREALVAGKCTNLYVKNLENYITDDALRSKFAEFGDVKNATVMKDELGKSKGFGFVSFASAEEGKKAMEALNGSILGSQTIYVGVAQRKVERSELLKLLFSEEDNDDYPKQPMVSNVYVKFLNDSVDDKALGEYFGQCGNVVSARVMRLPNGMSKGIGFVCFSSSAEATKAVGTLNGSFFHGKRLFVDIARPKEERLKEVQTRFATSATARPYSHYSGYVSDYSHYYDIPYNNYSYISPEAVYNCQQYAPSWSSYNAALAKYYAHYASASASASDHCTPVQQSSRTPYPLNRSSWTMQQTKSGGCRDMNHHRAYPISQKGLNEITITPNVSTKVKITTCRGPPDGQYKQLNAFAHPYTEKQAGKKLN